MCWFFDNKLCTVFICYHIYETLIIAIFLKGETLMICYLDCLFVKRSIKLEIVLVDFYTEKKIHKEDILNNLIYKILN